MWIQTHLSLRLNQYRRRDETHTSAGLLYRYLRELNSGMSDLAAPFGYHYHVRNDSLHRTFEERLANVSE